jgi:plasmid stabilization system protein ParE
MAEQIAVTLANSALQDLQELLDYYREQGAHAIGQRLVNEILDAIDSLADFPDRGRMVPEFEQPFLRELIHPPFRIVYRRETRRIRVVRAWRSERQLTLPRTSEQ